MKKILGWILAAAVLIGIMPAALADGAEGLGKIRDYGDAGFTDVADDWSLDYIRTVYEIGLMSGKSLSVFVPDGNVTLAEGAMMAARLHNLWNGGDGVISQDGEHWYDNAVTYCRQNGILTGTDYANWETAATRAQLAGMFYYTVPESTLTTLNEISSVPDVGDQTPYHKEILALYRAGVLTGSDEYGTFHPDETITRAQTAAIICRVARPNTRETLTLKEKPEDLTVYTSSRILVLDGVEIFGLYEINGEYYIPVEVLNDNVYGRTELPGITATCYNGKVNVTLYCRNNGSRNLCNVSLEPIPAGRYAVATATRSDMKLVLTTQNDSGWYTDQTFENAVCTIDGFFPMVKLSVLGVDTSGTGKIVWDTKYENIPASAETDLVGKSMSGLIKSTPRETVRAIHDYVISHVEYDLDALMAPGDEELEPRPTEYELMNNITLDIGMGFCGEYAGLFQDMCLRAGIPCHKLSGRGNGGNHAWNMVYIDGQWLYVDCTWDDPPRGKETHDYFLVTPSKLAVDHFWVDEWYPLPQKNPSWDEWGKIDPNNITNADDFRKRLLYDLHQGKTTIVLKTTGKDAYGGVDCVAILDYYGEGCGILKVRTSKNTYTVTVSDEIPGGGYIIF